MAIRTKDEILNAIRTILPEEADDASTAILEDITDTITDYETRTQDSTDWKTRYEENDREWRQKYRDRFFNTGSDDKPEDFDEPEDIKPMRFEDLFTTKE